MTVIDKPLTNLQLELNKLFILDLSDKQMLDIKQLLSHYFADQASDEMDRLWEENIWSNVTMDNWLKDN